ncbi:hypothetical protein [Escherichia coli]|nr:hypothetical protein [Escherichia coli]
MTHSCMDYTCNILSD